MIHTPDELSEPTGNLLTIGAILITFGTMLGLLVAISAILLNMAKFFKIMTDEDTKGMSLWKKLLKYFKGK